jgi:hypothetical protein
MNYDGAKIRLLTGEDGEAQLRADGMYNIVGENSTTWGVAESRIATLLDDQKRESEREAIRARAAAVVAKERAEADARDKKRLAERTSLRRSAQKLPRRIRAAKTGIDGREDNTVKPDTTPYEEWRCTPGWEKFVKVATRGGFVRVTFTERSRANAERTLESTGRFLPMEAQPINVTVQEGKLPRLGTQYIAYLPIEAAAVLPSGMALMSVEEKAANKYGRTVPVVQTGKKQLCITNGPVCLALLHDGIRLCYTAPAQ